MTDLTTWDRPDAPPIAADADAFHPPEAAVLPTPPPVGRSTWRRGAGAAGLTILALVAGATGGFVGQRLAGEDAATTAVATARVSAPGGATTLDVAAVLAAVEGAVADIQATGPRGRGQGSGVVYSADGLVLTNAHVVEGATQVTVTTPGDRQARNATVVGTDAARDIAVLRLENTDGLVVAQLGSSSDVAVGQDVVAIGNALGLRGDPSVTRGIVSALDRTIGDLAGLLQTDAAINSGNSGGPLVNANGQVIGINTAIAVQNNAQNIGFAIPIDAARSIAERLVSGRSPTTAFLGVATSDNDAATTGATVGEITAGSPAARAGLAVGDVIVAVDGEAVSGAAALGRVIGDQQPGATVTLTVLRNGQERKIRATLGQK